MSSIDINLVAKLASELRHALHGEYTIGFKRICMQCGFGFYGRDIRALEEERSAHVCDLSYLDGPDEYTIETIRRDLSDIIVDPLAGTCEQQDKLKGTKKQDRG